MLIRAFAIFVGKDERYSEYKLYVMGDGEERYKLEKLAETLEIKENIIFTGYIDNKLVREYMNKS